MTAKILFLVNQVVMQQEILIIIHIFWKIQLILSSKRVLGSKLRYTLYTRTTSCSDGNGVTDQRQINEKPINKLQSLYCIAFKQNVD